jgi:hypothetical protein
MELIHGSDALVPSLVSNFVSAVVIAIFFRFVTYIADLTFFYRTRVVLARNFIYRTTTCLVVFFLCAYCLNIFEARYFGNNFDVSFVVLLAMFIILLYRDWSFSRVGLASAERHVKSGTNYEAALSICRDGFSFLGTGAYKLTHSRRFEDALMRCNREPAKVRFLLSPPDNAILLEAERQANVAPGTYKKNVIESLKLLKKFHDDRSLNFEVRFYLANTGRDFENFRMMFINDDILLLSYNAYGHGDGRDAPQLILDQKAAAQSQQNFYFPFKNYYERLWGASEIWDFKKYV